MRREHFFGSGFVEGTIPSGFPVFWVAVPGCSRNGYGTSPNLSVQKKFIKFKQSTQNTWLRPAEFFWKFISYSRFDFLRNLGDILLSPFWVQCVVWRTVPCFLRCFPRNCRYFSLLLQSCPDTELKVLSAVKTKFKLYFLEQKCLSPPIKREKINEDKTVDDFNKKYYTGRLQFYIIRLLLSILLFIPFPGGKHKCLHAKLKYK